MQRAPVPSPRRRQSSMTSKMRAPEVPSYLLHLATASTSYSRSSKGFHRVRYTKDPPPPVISMPQRELIYELHLPEPTPSNNAVKGMHFHAYKKLRNSWRASVLAAIGSRPACGADCMQRAGGRAVLRRQFGLGQRVWRTEALAGLPCGAKRAEPGRPRPDGG